MQIQSSFKYVRCILLSVALALGLASASRAQYPERPIKLIVPYPPGGSSDILARSLGAYLERSLQQPIVVENAAGAGGGVGTRRAITAAPDGYTLLLGANSELLIHKAIQPKTIEYDALRDLTPIAFVGAAANVLVGRKNLAASNWQEVLALANGTPKGLSYGSAGHGTIQHLAGEMIRERSKLKATHVAYQGGGPLLKDLAGGHVDLGVTTLAPALPFIKSGQLRAYVVTSAQRTELAPAVPTATELPQLSSVILETWYGVFAPAKLPEPIATRLARSVNEALDDPELKQKLAAQALTTRRVAGKEFRDFVQREGEKYAAMVAETDLADK